MMVGRRWSRGVAVGRARHIEPPVEIQNRGASSRRKGEEAMVNASVVAIAHVEHEHVTLGIGAVHEACETMQCLRHDRFSGPTPPTSIATHPSPS